MPDPLFTTIYSSINPMETHLMAGLLESEGLDAFVDNDHTVNANWLYSNALGGVTLRVYTEDADRAREIIHRALSRDETDLDAAEHNTAETDDSALNPGHATPPDTTPAYDLVHPQCPKCAGTHTVPQLWPIIGLLGCWVGVPLIFRDRYRCRDCGLRWKEK